MHEEKELVLLRIFLTDKDKLKGKPVYNLLLENFLKEGIAGATVFHGIAGYGAKKIIHSAGILDVSDALPVVVEVCDTSESIQKALEITKKIFSEAKVGGFLTYEKAKVILFKEEA
ncbi:MAG: DUF190 domain-containing protein [Leptospiraceae bacterium]|nr:DUF190 domain-containing protein [Leptospiraceae bacterium]MDW7976287.1 DUF190 domain-containing protein [Leptospiraceae bacterium]